MGVGASLLGQHSPRALHQRAQQPHERQRLGVVLGASLQQWPGAVSGGRVPSAVADAGEARQKQLSSTAAQA